ncbi:hypothetical protein ACOMHN_038302 [Nucella lapillus]
MVPDTTVHIFLREERTLQSDGTSDCFVVLHHDRVRQKRKLFTGRRKKPSPLCFINLDINRLPGKQWSCDDSRDFLRAAERVGHQTSLRES